MVRGEPDRANVVAHVAQTDGTGVIDECAQESLAFGQVSDHLDGVRVHADVDELLQATSVGPDDAQCAVGGVDQLAGRLDDASQDGAQAQVSDDGPVGAQESSEPVLGGLDVLCPVDQLSEELVQFEMWHVSRVARSLARGLRFVVHGIRR